MINKKNTKILKEYFSFRSILDPSHKDHDSEKSIGLRKNLKNALRKNLKTE